jgi:Family of unknown function (DUF5996)
MSAEWPAVNYEEWSPVCDTLHAHSQLLGKLAVALAPPEPELMHAALRLTARGIETVPLPAPDGEGAVVALLDLGAHEAVIETTAGRSQRVPLTPNRTVGEVTRDVVDAVRRMAGPVNLNPIPQEVPWTVPLDEDDEHGDYDAEQVSSFFLAATQAALVLAEFRAPFRGRSTQVNFWWGSFDLAVSLFSGEPATPPSDEFIIRNSMDAQDVAVGWWPGDTRYGKAAFYAYAHPAPEAFANATLEPAATRWDPRLGEYLLDWDDVREQADPRAAALDFARSAFRHACAVCDWDPRLAATAEGRPPPVS